ncbi:MAG: alkaline phosphatase [Petrimonas sp.]|nr:alkaline phosphatase [Petrimonas sp.]
MNAFFYRSGFVLFFLSFSISFFCQNIEKEIRTSPKNVIFMIGDGMGLSHVHAAMTVSQKKLNLQQFPVIGLQETESSDNYITDSAASATALASGEKARNGVIGINPDGAFTESIIEVLIKQGFKTGLIATNTITHATPAAFIAHQPDRNMYEEIAADISNSGINIIIGGGLKHFTDRADKLNLVEKMKKQGYDFFEDVSQINSSRDKVLALTANSHMPFKINGRGDFLPVAVEKALYSLNKDNDKGFFLMVEGSQIDPACHNNDQEQFLAEMLDFDKAIGVALDFARENGETLVVVTGDHETGGVTVLKGNYETGEVKVNFSTKGHTGVMLPVYSYGPGSEIFSGFFDNTDFKERFIFSLNLKNK